MSRRLDDIRRHIEAEFDPHGSDPFGHRQPIPYDPEADLDLVGYESVNSIDAIDAEGSPE